MMIPPEGAALVECISLGSGDFELLGRSTQVRKNSEEATSRKEGKFVMNVGEASYELHIFEGQR